MTTVPVYPSFGAEPLVHSTGNSPAWVGPVLVVGLIGIVGYAIYMQGKVVQTVAEKEGSTGLLKYSAGTAAIGLAERALSPQRKNRRKSRRKRR